MHIRKIILMIALPVLLSAPAHAEYVHAHYEGSILETAPDGDGLSVGTPINFDAVYDISKLVNVTASINASLGEDFFTDIETVSLAEDSNASLSIMAGPVSFNKFDQLYYGTPGSDCGPNCDLGVGNFPVVYYINGSFAGLGNILINSNGDSIDADPVAYALSGGFGLDGPGTDSYNFYIGKGDADNPFTTGSAVGDIDLSTLTITAAAPEPSAWALMIAGVAIAGGALRTGRRRSWAIA